MLSLYAIKQLRQTVGLPNIVDDLQPVVCCMVFTSISVEENSTSFSSTRNRDSGMKTYARLPEQLCAQQAACLHNLVTTGAAVNPPGEFCQAPIWLQYTCMLHVPLLSCAKHLYIFRISQINHEVVSHR